MLPRFSTALVVSSGPLWHTVYHYKSYAHFDFSMGMRPPLFTEGTENDQEKLTGQTAMFRGIYQ